MTRYMWDIVEGGSMIAESHNLYGDPESAAIAAMRYVRKHLPEWLSGDGIPEASHVGLYDDSENGKGWHWFALDFTWWAACSSYPNLEIKAW